MDNKARLWALLTLGAAVTAGPVITAGCEAKAQELDWATSAGGTGFDSSRGIATDQRGNSYVTGFFRRTATFGPGEANQTTLESAGGADVFVAKYAPDGTLLWARSAGGPDTPDSPVGAGAEFGIGIATDPRENSYVTGAFHGTATFGAGEANETTLESAGGNDLFVAKYAPDGTLLWATSAGGTGLDSGSGIARDPRGNSYVTGLFEARATFGAGEADDSVLSSAGSFDMFVAKYRP